MATTTVTSSLTVNLAGYNTSYTTISGFNSSYPVTNAYADSSSTTYAYATATKNSTTYVSFTFGDISSIPSDATITSVTCNAKWRVQSTNRITSLSVQLYSGNTAKGSATTTRSQTATSYALTCGTWTRSELDSLMLRFTQTMSNSNNGSGTYIYGADLTINYTYEETSYTVTVTSSGDGTTTPAGVNTVASGDSLDITFVPGDTASKPTVTDNGTDISDSLVSIGDSVTLNAVISSYDTVSGLSGTAYLSAVGKGSDTSTTSTSNDYASGSSSNTVTIYYNFDLTSIPSGSIINSITCSVKGHEESDTSTSETALCQLYKGTTAVGTGVSFTSTSDAVITITDTGTWSYDDLSNLKLGFTVGYYGGAVVGATLSVNYSETSSANVVKYTYTLSNITTDHTIVATYTETTTYNVTSSISGGTIQSPTTNPTIVKEGNSYTIKFIGDDGATFKSMSVNGTNVTPSQTSGSTITLTASTNTSEYTTDSNGIQAICDGDESTYYWDQTTQAAGDYMMIEISDTVYLKGVSTVTTKSSTDYFKSNCELLISTNGSDWVTIGTCADSSTQSFTGINQNCKYVRFYVTTASSSWWCCNEITLDYDYTADTVYSYTIDSVTQDTAIDIVFTGGLTRYDVNIVKTNAIMINPTALSSSVLEGSNLTISFKNADESLYVFRSMKVNGTTVDCTTSEVSGTESFTGTTSITSGNTYYIYSGTNYLTQASGAITTSATDRTSATAWTFTSSGSGWLISSGSYYLTIVYNNSARQVGLTTDSSAAVIWTLDSTGILSGYYDGTSGGEAATMYLRGNSTSTNAVYTWGLNSNSDQATSNMVWEYNSGGYTQYSYTISNITSTQTIIITFGENEWLYIKNSEGEWVVVNTVYQHAGNCWWSITKDELKAKLVDSGKTIATLVNLKFNNDEYLDQRTLLFEDDFDTGSLNKEIWTPEIGFCRNDNAVAYYTEDAISFEDSNLVITATKDSSLPNATNNSGSSWKLTYKSASIQSQDKYLILYGRVQAKIKCPGLAGTWPAFWLFGNDRKFSEYHTDGTILSETGTDWSECGEIDIIEQYGTALQYEWNLWQSQSGASSSYLNGTYSLNPTEWHIYEIEWTPTTMQYLVDGTAVSSTIDITTSQGQAYVNDKFFMILNLQLGGTAGTVSGDNIKMYVDWVRVYDYIKSITLTYNCGDYTEIETGIAITDASIPTSAQTVTQGSSYNKLLFPLIGYKFDSVTITMDGEDITDDAYDANIKTVDIQSITGDIVISTTTSIDTEGHEYAPIQTLPDGYSSLTINGSSGVSLNGYTLNPGYNTDTSATTLNIELVMPTDYEFDVDTIMILPEEMNFSSGVEDTGTSISNGVINDASVAGQWPMWNVTNWNDNNYFVFTLPISIVGTTLDEVNEWLNKNPITVYYPGNGTSALSEDEETSEDSLGTVDASDSNTLSLNSSSLDSGTYTLAYEDEDGTASSDYGSLGTVTV